jgi:hypothetical protein
MVTASFINRLSQAVDQIEKRLKQNRPLKIVKVRRGYEEDPDQALDRHFAAYPEDGDANIVIFKFCDDEGTTDETQDRGPPARLAREEPSPLVARQHRADPDLGQ